MHMSYFGVTGTLASGDVSSGFQSQSGFCLICICGGKFNGHSLRYTSGATPAELLQHCELIQSIDLTFQNFF